MTTEEEAPARLRFASSILARLGEELIPDADQGLLELARNAYDAGASQCRIELQAADAVGGSVLIGDDGDGMSRRDITDGFLVVGRSRKSRRHRGRLTVGEKGLGRLAALRLGHRVTVITRPRDEGVEYTLELDWDRFEAAQVVEDVSLEIEVAPTEKPMGTDIFIQGLRRPLSKAQQNNLARSLLLLSDPFGAVSEFEAVLQTDAFGDLARLIREEYLAAADFKLVAQLDAQGKATASLRGTNGEMLAKASHSELSDEGEIYGAPPCSLELYVFRLGSGPTKAAANLRLRQVGVRKVSDWLKAVGGVHLYHRGLRVRPFGDPGYDWLQLDLKRVRSPEDRPSTNTVVGRISVDDERDTLVPKTDRVGFVENDAFNELHRFAVDATEFMAKWRTEDSRTRRLAERAASETRVDKARATLDDAVSKLPAIERNEIASAVRSFELATKRQDEARLRDVQLYRTLSTVGAATAVFAHESDKPTEQLRSLLKSTRRRVERALGGEVPASIEEPLTELDRVAAALRALAQMPLRLLRADRRRVKTTSVSKSVDDSLETFDYFLARAGIVVVRKYAAGDRVKAAAAALDVVIANMIVNAVAAFYADKRPNIQRALQISTIVDDDQVVLEISDNGPGLQRIRPEDVWKLGETRREGGSGLGLTIVRDTVSDLGGRAEVISPGPLGGATFLVYLPRPKS